MFTFAKEGKVWWRVNLIARDADGGDPREVPVRILYRIYTRAEMKLRERKLAGPLAKLRGSDVNAIQDALKEAEALNERYDSDLAERICDWGDIAGADGEPLPFSRDALRALLDDDAQYTPLAAGLVEASKGARAKNSSPGLAGSRAPGQV